MACHREQVRQVAGRLRQRHHQRAVVGRLEALDRVGLSRAEVVEPVDDVVVEVVAAHRRVGVGLALERANDVPGRHADVAERIPVRHAALERERVGQAVRRDLRQRARDVGLQVGAALGGGPTVVRQERPEQTAPVPLPRHRVVLLLWVERGTHVAEHRELDGAARLELAARAGRRRRTGSPGSTPVIAATCRGDETEYGDERQYAEISPHVTPLSLSLVPTVFPGRARVHLLALQARRSFPPFRKAASRLDTVSRPSWDRGHLGARPRPG